MDMQKTLDTIVIGGGPAGYSAAIYAARASLSTLVLEQGMPGGQIATSDMVENYPGIPSISGAELGAQMQAHAEEAGAQSAYGMVTRLSCDRGGDTNGVFSLETDMERYRARSVIVATGATPRQAGFAGEATFRGRGVSYCATCDGMFYRGKHVFVIGGGNSACEEAIYLSRIADSVEMIVRRDAFRASKGMVDRLLAHANVTVRYQTSIVAVEGERFIGSITFRDNATDTSHTEHFDEGSIGIFVFAGNDPITDLVTPYVELGPDGGVVTDESMATGTPGLFCAGDMRSKLLRQVVTAAADGAIAGNAAYRYVEERFRSHVASHASQE